MRVVVYGSASKDTPQAFKDASFELGRLLAQRGHICVNGGGNTGCMGSLSDGCLQHGGKNPGPSCSAGAAPATSVYPGHRDRSGHSSVLKRLPVDGFQTVCRLGGLRPLISVTSSRFGTK